MSTNHLTSFDTVTLIEDLSQVEVSAVIKDINQLQVWAVHGKNQLNEARYCYKTTIS